MSWPQQFPLPRYATALLMISSKSATSFELLPLVVGLESLCSQASTFLVMQADAKASHAPRSSVSEIFGPFGLLGYQSPQRTYQISFIQFGGLEEFLFPKWKAYPSLSFFFSLWALPFSQNNLFEGLVDREKLLTEVFPVPCTSRWLTPEL